MNDKITAIYSDDKGGLTDRENAERVELTEYDKNGKRVKTVYGRWVKVPTLEDIERQEREIMLKDIFTELEAKLVWDFETDKEAIAELYEKYKNFSDIDMLLGDLFHYHLRRNGSIAEDDFYEKIKLLIKLSAYFRDNIKETS